MAGWASSAGRSTAEFFGVELGVESGEVRGEREKSSSTKRSSAGKELDAERQMLRKHWARSKAGKLMPPLVKFDIFDTVNIHQGFEFTFERHLPFQIV